MTRISVITVSYNSSATIEDTIRSVSEQTHPDKEYIIIDGGSVDGTVDIINRNINSVSLFISEKDEGLYHAINKGISLATGEIIAILHADDLYAFPHVLSKVAEVFEMSGADTVYGDLDYVKRTDTTEIVRRWRSGGYYDGIFTKGWMPPHPAFFVRRKLYEQYGVYTTVLRSASDYEMMLRLLHKHKCTTAYLPEVLVKMRAGGKSNVSFLNRLRANREDKKAWLMNGLRPGIFTFIRKPLSKLGQFFGRK